MLRRVHLITDSRPGADPVAQVRGLLPVATDDLVIQFRSSKSWSDGYRFEAGREIVALCHAAGVPVLINDRIDIAMAVSADGAHVGASDLPVAVARRLLGAGKILGATARTAAQAARAVADGADYVGVGPCYQSSTKDGLPPPIGPAGLAAVVGHAPVIAIGGITPLGVPEVMRAGAHGVAVIGAVADAPDPIAALRSIMDLCACSTACRDPNPMIDAE